MVRFIALGDSLTEGVGDPHPAWPNGLRGWADLVAAQLAEWDPRSDYANLALRGKTAADVLAEQVPVALELRPDVVSIWAGGNDILRPRMRLGDVLAPVEAAVAQLSATGAAVLVFTGFEVTGSPILGAVRARVRMLNGALQGIARAHGALVSDVSGRSEWADRRLWADDRVHPSPWGHQRLAGQVGELIGLPRALGTDESRGPEPSRPWRRLVADEAIWWREHAAPHIARWATGASRRELVVPKWSVPIRPARSRPWCSDPAELGGMATI